ncbi:hypothetical protein Q5P01_000919 [Channa striata]|uniref:Uncharacterized protein n=1 Tax=Channa striata TaxID=64152 RepID=A0AA88LIP1_CHASR|nr:hypothetical protein Q5P01_000919 [Channa striata]
MASRTSAEDQRSLSVGLSSNPITSGAASLGDRFARIVGKRDRGRLVLPVGTSGRKGGARIGGWRRGSETGELWGACDREEERIGLDGTSFRKGAFERLLVISGSFSCSWCRRAVVEPDHAAIVASDPKALRLDLITSLWVFLPLTPFICARERWRSACSRPVEPVETQRFQSMLVSGFSTKNCKRGLAA